MGSWKSPQFAGEVVPTLDELLATVPPGKRFFVEVKCDREIIGDLRRTIERSAVPARDVVLISLRIDLCSELKRELPDCPVYWVVEFKHDGLGHWQPTRERMGWDIEKHWGFIDGFDLMATGPIDAELISDCKMDDGRAYVWTVDETELAKRLINMGVDGITTNRPGWLREQLRQ